MLMRIFLAEDETTSALAVPQPIMEGEEDDDVRFLSVDKAATPAERSSTRTIWRNSCNVHGRYFSWRNEIPTLTRMYEPAEVVHLIIFHN